MLPWDELVDDARVRAHLHLERVADPQDPPTDILGVASELGIRVMSRPFWHDVDFTGVCVWDPNSFRLVIVNSLMAVPLWGFVVAHEIGHLVLGHQPPRHPQVERLADAYAGELLVPTDRLIRQIERYGRDIRVLAGLNRVSVTLIRQRLGEVAMAMVS